MSRRGLNVYLRKDGRWEGRFVKGKAESKTLFGYVYGNSYRETVKKLVIARSRHKINVTKKSDESARLINIGANWLSHTEPQLKPSTVSKYKDYLRCYIYPALGRKKIADITDADIADFCSALMRHGKKDGTALSSKTVAEILRVLKRLRIYAISRKYDVGYTLDYIKVKQNQQELRVFTDTEQRRLRNYLKRSDNLTDLGILLSLETGMRIGELCALTWDDISLDDKLIYVRRTMQRISCNDSKNSKTKIILTSPKSERSKRIIPIPDELCARLKRAKRNGAVFLTGRSGKYMEPRTMQNRFKTVLFACDIEEAGFHSLRHTFSTKWVEKGLDIKCLSAILGHASVNITLNRYVHTSMDMKRKNMDLMAF
ncbi:MAG: site-specific integrase [Selenomonadaceae bacterium]|nr:site-specific integrase [Selenomonadaceae bacterium]